MKRKLIERQETQLANAIQDLDEAVGEYMILLYNLNKSHTDRVLCKQDIFKKEKMNKAEYFEIPEVTSFIRWLSKTQDDLYEKWFKGYQWGRGKSRKDYWETQKELDAYAKELKNAIKGNNNENVQNVCAKILHWGGMYGKYPKISGDGVIQYLEYAKAGFTTAKIEKNDTFPGIELNSGYVKIYSLLFDKFIMYDGRVGAGLCYLVRKFCEKSDLKEVPEELKFTFGPGKQTKDPKNRNPCKGNYKFTNHNNTSEKNRINRIRRTIMANWLVEKALTGNVNSHFNMDEKLKNLPVSQKMRAFEAALFMLGDRLPE
jgi:hypothetical protein